MACSPSDQTAFSAAGQAQAVKLLCLVLLRQNLCGSRASPNLNCIVSCSCSGKLETSTNLDGASRDTRRGSTFRHASESEDVFRERGVVMAVAAVLPYRLPRLLSFVSLPGHSPGRSHGTHWYQLHFCSASR